MEKNELRIKYKNIRKNIDVANKKNFDNSIFNKIINLKEYKDSKTILTYVSLQDEVDTLKLIEHSISIGKLVAVPKCEKENINFYYINNINDLKKGKFNILEPENDNIVQNFNCSICIIPGIAFDKDNNRIGYGKGYYDKFLCKYNGVKIGLCYKECLCENIDKDNYDIKMNTLISN